MDLIGASFLRQLARSLFSGDVTTDFNFYDFEVFSIPTYNKIGIEWRQQNRVFWKFTKLAFSVMKNKIFLGEKAISSKFDVECRQNDNFSLNCIFAINNENLFKIPSFFPQIEKN